MLLVDDYIYLEMTPRMPARKTKAVKKIGLIPMSAKPYHAGHDGLVRLAAEECDEVHLFVSTSDRMRPGEFPIYGADMEKLWKKYIAPSLPTNVSVTYGGSPVRNVWNELGEASEAGSSDTYAIYSDEEDIKKYTHKSLRMYAPGLFERRQIQLRGISRSETVDVSGTAMRAMLASGNVKGFARYLPPALRPHSKKIISMLKRSSELYAEAMIRKTIRNMILHEDTASGIRDTESPFGVTLDGDSKQLFDIFVQPFVDTFKVGVAGIKKISVRTKTMIEVAVKSAISTIFPAFQFQYSKIFENEKKQLEEIKKKYSEVYKRVDSAFENGDAALFAFMASPSTFLALKGGAAGLDMGSKASMELLSVVSAGYSDKLIQKIKEKNGRFEKWLLDGFEFGSRSRRSTRKKEESLAARYKLLKEQDDEEVKKFEELIAQVFEKSLESPAAQKMKEEASEIYKSSLRQAYSQAKTALKDIATVEDIEKFLGSKIDPETKKKIQEIKSLQDKEKIIAEKKLIEGIREGSKDFYVRNLEDQVNIALKAGVVEDTQYIKDYRETISKIKSL